MRVKEVLAYHFLRKWLNRFLRFWYQVKAMNPLLGRMFSDFVYNPRGANPSSFTKLQNSSDI